MCLVPDCFESFETAEDELIIEMNGSALLCQTRSSVAFCAHGVLLWVLKSLEQPGINSLSRRVGIGFFNWRGGVSLSLHLHPNPLMNVYVCRRLCSGVGTCPCE